MFEEYGVEDARDVDHNGEKRGEFSSLPTKACVNREDCGFQEEERTHGHWVERTHGHSAHH